MLLTFLKLNALELHPFDFPQLMADILTHFIREQRVKCLVQADRFSFCKINECFYCCIRNKSKWSIMPVIIAAFAVHEPFWTKQKKVESHFNWFFSISKNNLKWIAADWVVNEQMIFCFCEYHTSVSIELFCSPHFTPFLLPPIVCIV